jgi:hypothetical protein
MVARSFHRKGEGARQHILVLQTSTYFYRYQWWLGRSLVEGRRGAVDLCNGTWRAALLDQGSTLWWSLRLDFTLTQFMGGCSLVAASEALSF